jgi:hypothetical protein
MTTMICCVQAGVPGDAATSGHGVGLVSTRI